MEQKYGPANGPFIQRDPGYLWPIRAGMESTSVRAIYRSFADDRLSFLYSGLFHDEHTARLVALGEEFIAHEGTDRGLRGKLGFIMVEMYQNIVRHRVELPAGPSSPNARSMFLLRSTGNTHEVTAINPVASGDAERLEAELSKLKGMDLAQMKQVFLSGLQDDSRTSRGGAGLGLIEMARRSGYPLRYDLDGLGPDHALFTLRALVGKQAQWRNEAGALKELHATAMALGLSLLFRGVLNAGEQEVFLRIIERDLDMDRPKSNAHSRAFLAVMELMANLETTGHGPMVLLRNSDDGVRLLLGVPLSSGSADRARHALAEVNAMDAVALQRRYRDILLGRGPASDSLQLGLVELARRHGTPIDASIEEDGFFVLEVLVR